MIQHLLVLMTVCPLAVAASPWVPLWYGLPNGLRCLVRPRVDGPLWTSAVRAGRALWRPSMCFTVFVVGTWVWHWPALYDRALENEILHNYGEHNTFLLVGIIFWLQVIPSAPFRPVCQYFGRCLYLVGAVVQNVMLSVVLGFGSEPLYAPYGRLAHRLGGISAHEDQQIGAAIMWSIGDLPFVVAIVTFVLLWLQASMRHDESAPDPRSAVSTKAAM